MRGIELTVLSELMPDAKFEVINGENLIWKDERPQPTQEQIEKKIKELEIKEKTHQVETSLMQLCDGKQVEAQKLILGYKATPMQMERYKDKYQRAKAGEFDMLTNQLIIAKYEKYLTEIRKFIDLIEYFRGKVDDLIKEGNLEKATKSIEKAKKFDATTTLNDIKSLFY